jgi:uncharacterized protein YjaG (DUF416 family)
MTEEVVSFEDYVSLIKKKLRSLRHFERCLFSAWCAERLLITQAALVESEFSASDLRVLQEILDQIWEQLLAGSIPTTGILNDLENRLMQIGPDESVGAIEFHPVVTRVQSAILLCILNCGSNDVGLARCTKCHRRS